MQTEFPGSRTFPQSRMHTDHRLKKSNYPSLLSHRFILLTNINEN